ncbi:carbohydrate ABC transporter permease [Massiliimalia massiliensis]|uniref:carbohydrate ABC transporter permease n=1 Tax=Massiliimalia massiliensis TaxID=1852384 RepID=UPI000986D329|nr:carbohydrate ABC transporter permease [Massiliimalia massiliensis]
MTSNKIKGNPVQKVISYLLAILLLLLVLIPFITALVSSFKTADDFYGNSYTLWPSDWRIENYLDAWNFAAFGTFLKNSIVCAVVVTICSTIISSFAAFGFARLHFFGRDVIFYIFIMTQGIPFVVLFIPTYLLMNNLGLVNTLAGLILPLISFPMGTFLMRQTMLSIPIDYEYAAMIDGCNRFQMFFKVFLPMVNNTVMALAIFTFMGSWNNYIWPLVIISDQKLYTLPIGLTLYTVQSSMGRRPEWSVIMAAALLSVLPIMIVYCFASRRFMEGIALGGLKA